MAARFTVFIIGDGPAALATAITLCAAGGVEVRLTAPRYALASRHGDSLSPHGRAVLARLGVWSGLGPDEAIPCHATQSIWGAGQVRHVDYITHPLGPAWHVDRARLGERMRARAAALGACFDVDGRRLSLRSAGTRWCCADADRDIQADVVVDASGRAAWLARRLGAKRTRSDRQIALFISGAGNQWPGDGMGLVESAPQGWWYSAPAPASRWTVACFTDADLVQGRQGGELDWAGLLASSGATRGRLEANGVALRGHATAAADSARLDHMAGDGWLAVGDAAVSYDPLSAHGLTFALQSGVDAARAILSGREGEPHAIEAYTARLDAAFAAYSRERRDLYCSETRFADHAYWQRRHSSVEIMAAAQPD